MIKEGLKKIIKNSIEFLGFHLKEVNLDHSSNKDFGDYSTNVAMVLSKIIKKSPMEIAEKIKLQIETQKSSLIEKVEVVNPGFVNFFLKKEIFLKELEKILKEKEKYGSSKIGRGKKIIIDYSGPNIAKRFGIGHLRSTIIGQAVYNIYNFLGYKCIGDNHLGDWGTQFGKLIYEIIDKKISLNSLTIDVLEQLYVQFHKEAEENPRLEEKGREWFKKLEEKNEKAIKIWKKCVEISMKNFEKIYNLLGIKIDYSLGESFYEPMLKKIIKEIKKNGLGVESQGALIFKYSNDEFPPAMLLKSDKTTTYFLRDLATIKFRLKKWKPFLIVYEVGAEQKLHLQQLFRAVELLGWAKKEQFFHISHGLYRTKEGKFSTRKGATVHLEDVLEEAIAQAKEMIKDGIEEKEKNKIAKIVGVGAIKYNDLKEHCSKDIIFSWEKILNLKGNSGPYLQYTFARCQSVLEKTENKIKKAAISEFAPEEIKILREIYKFPEIVEEAAKKFSPNIIANFIFNLAQEFNCFYDAHPILKAENENLKSFRLLLTQCVAQVLKNSLSLLGISLPNKM